MKELIKTRERVKETAVAQQVESVVHLHHNVGSSIPCSSCPHAEVSLSKTLNPALLPMFKPMTYIHTATGQGPRTADLDGTTVFELLKSLHPAAMSEM